MNVKVPHLPSDYFSGMEIFFLWNWNSFFFGMIKQTYSRWSHQNLIRKTKPMGETILGKPMGETLLRKPMGETLYKKLNY